MPVNTTIKIRKGTEADWTSSNPVLASGEPGLAIDSNRFKIGNGIDSWNALNYASIVPSGFLASSGININLGSLGTSATISVSGLNSSYISDFNSAVSGLLPVKDIVSGTGIGVTSSSGVYTIAVSGVSELISEEVDDRVSQLLVEGTGVNLTYNDASGTLTIDNLHTEINILSQEPQGFVNKTDSVISFDDSSRTFTIQPAISGGSYSVYVEGTKIVKNTTETVVLGSGTALNYIHFDTTTPYALQTKTTGFNFDTDVPIAFIHWNSDINQSTFFGEERHGIRMDSVTHKWIHNTFGMQYISGLSIGGYILLGDGSSNTHAQIDISDGVLYQEDIIINITDDNGTNSANAFVQPLSPIAYIPTYYHSGSTGQWVRDIATAFPVKYNGTRAQYNLFSGGTWTTPNVTNDRFFAMWIVATNDINDPILAIVGQREDSSLNSAESNNTWSDINLTNIPTQEIRPLYRLIFKTNSTYTNTPKSSLQSILDIRVAIQSTSLGVVQNDHGSLFGLADDDHSQYVHIDNARTITANHTFSNNINVSGIINANSGNFGSIHVSGTPVSVSGHTHSSSNITNFNSSVSGLLPSVSGSGFVTTSFSNNTYNISVSGLQPTNSSRYIICNAGDDIVAKYTEAKALTPGGSAKSATNRAHLIVMPGVYSLSDTWTIDGEFVDIIGLGSSALERGCKVAVTVIDYDINVSADDVRIKGIGTSLSFGIIGNKPLQVFEECSGGDQSFGYFNQGDASGTFTNCSGGERSFGGDSMASGKFTNCISGSESFGSYDSANGTFINCTGGNDSFSGGLGATASANGIFINCIGGDYSFGVGDSAGGTFTNCTGGIGSFGRQSIASGTFNNCTGGAGSFGFGAFAVTSGTFTNCTGGNNSFGYDNTASGTFTNCTGGDNSFGSGDVGTASGTFTNCTGGDNSFGSSDVGTASGTFTSCTGGNSSFGSPSGKFYFCRLTSGTFSNPTGSGKFRLCIDGNNDVVNIDA